MDSPPTHEAALIVPQTGQIFPLDQDLMTIGRKPGNTIVLADDLKTSRYHATISWEAGRYMIQDAGSSNGTYLNGQRLTGPQPLNDGDIIQIGDTTFTVQLPADDTQPTLMRPAPVEETLVRRSTLDADATAIRDPAINPYVGPRTFTQQESDRFFGREHEARELLSLIIAERLVLFYAQSGAGKSSLINARLIPQLRQAGFPVLPIGRVSGELPEGVGEVDNIFVFNLMLSLDESDGDPNRFTRMNLTDFLARLTSFDGRHYYYDDEPEAEDEAEEEFYEETPYILIIDQFEEIVTAHPGRWRDREAFFRQLDQAMINDPLLWVVLTLREDYVATLDPYIHLLSSKLRARFYMQRMGYQAALEAIQKPAERYGRPFAPGVAESLVDNLRQVRIHGAQVPEQVQIQLGQFVEPVQLQVVCYQLWENLQGRPSGQITQPDLEELGDVDTALVQFYEQAVAEVVDQTGISEVDLRNWFETQLITEAGTRGTVYRGLEHTGGLPNEAVDLLVSKFLLRAEVRTGGTWYELVHDRFVSPILQDNRNWGLKQPLVQMAQAWDDADRSISKLLEGQSLKDALATNWKGLGPLVREFLEASQSAQEVRDRMVQAEKEAQRQRELEQAQALAEEQRKRIEEQARAAVRLRRRAVLLAALAVIALLLVCAAALFGVQANLNANAAKTQQAIAVAARSTAEADSTAAAANAAAARAILENQLATQTAVANLTMTAGEVLASDVEKLRTAEKILEATLTAQAMAVTLEPTPTDTPVPPTETATPVGIYTPEPTPVPTDTPTITPTPTPNPEILIVQSQLAQVRAEQTSVAERSTTEPSAPGDNACDIEPGGQLRSVWERYRPRLGCPIQAEPIGGFFAEQPFQNGFMVWSQILDVFIVAIGDDEGTWRLIENNELTSLNPSGAACTPEAPPPSPDLVVPIRGFGSVWCAFPEIRRAVGYGLVTEYGVDNDLLQLYEHGAILRASSGRVYIFFEEGMDYIRE